MKGVTVKLIGRGTRVLITGRQFNYLTLKDYSFIDGSLTDSLTTLGMPVVGYYIYVWNVTTEIQTEPS